MKILFWFSIAALIHSYFLYPALLLLFAKFYKHNSIVYENEIELPEVTVIMAVRNAEKVIEKKIRSIFESGYIKDKIHFLIGSDASDDNTDSIIHKLEKEFPRIYFYRFNQRLGKIAIVNKLFEKSKSEILILTDVHAFPEKGAILNLVKHFKNQEINVVGGKLRNLRKDRKGIAYEEDSFLKFEFWLKNAEGKIWGTMMGAYGAFYAIRKSVFTKVPDNFIVDDFYISIKAIEKKGRAICEPEAVAYENVPGDINTEFKRKTRISMGNFQNLKALFPVLYKRNMALSLAFFSHKIIRWTGPVLLIIIILSSGTLSRSGYFYHIFFIMMVLTFLAPIIDYFCRKIQIHVLILRFITHFYYMNLALLYGMFKFMKGVKTNVWEPTKRE
ncbi:MAG: glycosyltransferase [Bacteroidales bacterium]